MRGKPMAERIADRVAEPDENGCVAWTGQLDKQGYGRLGGRMAHRLVYMVEVGAIPGNMEVDHVCFNRACVAIAHLRLLTPSENHRRQRKAFRTTCLHGHERTEQNGRYIARNGGFDWQCRVCNRAAVDRYQARKKAALAVARAYLGETP